jgi:hypothetical protein
MSILSKIKNWLFTPAGENDAFGVHIREAAQGLFGHNCEWEHRAEPGEEEHGVNPFKRYCKHCDRVQIAMRHRFGNEFGEPRTEWEDLFK